MLTLLALLASIGIIQLFIPFFNLLADTEISIPWSNSMWWLLVLGSSALIGMIAAGYPVFCLLNHEQGRRLKKSQEIYALI